LGPEGRGFESLRPDHQSIQRSPAKSNNDAAAGIFDDSVGLGDGILLTDTEIRKAKPGSAPYHMTDGAALLMDYTDGGKLWRWKYRFQGVGKQMSYGQYPDITLAEARERHASARRLLASGIGAAQGRENNQPRYQWAIVP
jgi:hypothetical protein